MAPRRLIALGLQHLPEELLDGNALLGRVPRDVVDGVGRELPQRREHGQEVADAAGVPGVVLHNVVVEGVVEVVLKLAQVSVLFNS